MDKSTTISRENFQWLFQQPLDLKVGILVQHLNICQLIIKQTLEEEVKYLSGKGNGIINLMRDSSSAMGLIREV
jgi:hypothetical protein